MKSLLLTVCLLTNVCPWASNSGRFFPATSTRPAPVSFAARRELKITVDPRIELLSVVQSLTDYFLINKDDTSYRRAVEKHFATFKNHPAVKLFSQMWRKGFNFQVPPSAMLYLSNPPELKLQRPFTDEIIKRAGGPERLDQFLQTLRDFARASDFNSFYRANKKSYERMVDGVRAKARTLDYIYVLESYYRIRQHSYHVMLMPLAQELGFGVNLKRDDGRLDLYQMIGRSAVKDGFPLFGQGGEITLQNLVWHEFSHSFVNPLSEKHRETLAKYATLYAPISKQMSEQAYSDWEHAVNEHVIRALTSRLAALEISTEVGERELQADKQRGFIYIEALAERLKEYESQPGKYPTFADFYPRLIEVFKEIQERDKQ
ncbi:MAG TPA: DUF4932 domain-containing protein [Pyrinomonadaceae bacterium]|nr:DUF4932 domain-containing protein [Pyrinomonadaceae bacterium]